MASKSAPKNGSVALSDTRHPEPVSIETQTGLIFEEFVATVFDAE